MENRRVLNSGSFSCQWCAREALNLHPLRDQILSLARLPFRHSRDATRHSDIEEHGEAN
jgi:hypothetical protein